MNCLQLFTLICLYLFAKTSAVHSNLESRVLDGFELRPEFHRHLVLLKINERQPLSFMCSGSIIDRRWVVSSAHCFDQSSVTIVISHTMKGGHLIDIGVGEAVYRHPDYDFQGGPYLKRVTDIALVKTRQDFSDIVKPIALAVGQPGMGEMASIAGYGITEPHHNTPREGIVEITRCLSGQTDLICSYGKTRAASGDSGGPLVIKSLLYGVISTSNCLATDRPPCETASASIAHNYAWIRNITMRY